MDKLDTRGMHLWFTHSQKDALIRLSVAIKCSPAAIVRLALKELLEKGDQYVLEGVEAEDTAINEAIKKAKEDRI